MDSRIVFFGSIIFSITSWTFYVLASFQKSKRKIVGFYIGCDVADILMYLITAGKTGVANSVANLCRDITYAKFNNKKLTVFFAGLKILLLAFNYDGILTLFFIILQFIITYFLIKGTAQQLRFAFLVNQIIYVIYDYVFANIFVALITKSESVKIAKSPLIYRWDG